MKTTEMNEIETTAKQAQRKVRQSVLDELQAALEPPHEDREPNTRPAVGEPGFFIHPRIKRFRTHRDFYDAFLLIKP
jgi:hypothetical protein